MVKSKRSELTNIMRFWLDICIAASQVTFGIAAASWFVPPFDGIKVIALILNGLATIIFVVVGFKLAKRL